MKRFILICLFLMGNALAQNDQQISETLKEEWQEYRLMVDSLKADGDVGGYMLFKTYGEMILLWRTSEGTEDNEVIRFYMMRSLGVSFAVTYHKSNLIIPGKVVLRRFIGPEPTGWINHTIDYDSGEYLGSQGTHPEITSREKKMMDEWGITVF